MRRRTSGLRISGHAVAACLMLALLLPHSARAQACANGTFYCAGGPLALSGASGSGTSPNGDSHYFFQSYGDSVWASTIWVAPSSLSFGGSYTFLGLPAGTPVTQTMTAVINGTVSTLTGDGQCSSNRVNVGLQLDGTYVARAAWAGSFFQSECFGAGGTEAQSFSFTRAAGASFTLVSKVDGTTSFGSVMGGMRVRYNSITPGAFLVRCDGSAVTQLVGVPEEAPTRLRIASVWPNPSRGVFHANVLVPEGGAAILRLFDVTGRVVQAWPVEASASQRTVSRDTPLTPGTYFLQLKQGALTAVRQVVIGE